MWWTFERPRIESVTSAPTLRYPRARGGVLARKRLGRLTGSGPKRVSEGEARHVNRYAHRGQRIGLRRPHLILNFGVGVIVAEQVQCPVDRQQGKLTVLKAMEGDGDGWLIIDDLVDTGVTAQAVRKLLPKAHFATVYAKPAGRPLVDTFVTEVSQDTWILFPWDAEARAVDPIVKLRGAR